MYSHQVQTSTNGAIFSWALKHMQPTFHITLEIENNVLHDSKYVALEILYKVDIDTKKIGFLDFF
jgi:hypothetical protein